MGPYKPLRTWVDDHPLLYRNNGSLDPGTYQEKKVIYLYMGVEPKILGKPQNGWWK